MMRTDIVDHLDLPATRKERITQVTVPKTIVEHIVDVPSQSHVERIEEVQVPLTTKRFVPVPKYEVEDRLIKVPKPIIEEKVIEIPEIEWVEKVIEVPQYVYKERRVEVVRPVVHEKIIPIPPPTVTDTVHPQRLCTQQPTIYKQVPPSTDTNVYYRPDNTDYVKTSYPSRSSSGLNPRYPQPGAAETQVPPLRHTQARESAVYLPPDSIDFYSPSIPSYPTKHHVGGYALPPQFAVPSESHPLWEPAMDTLGGGSHYTFQNPLMAPYGRTVQYRHIPRYVEVGIPHYRPITVETPVERPVPVPVDLEIEEEILQPQWSPQYIEYPVEVPYEYTTLAPFGPSGRLPFAPFGAPSDSLVNSVLTDVGMRQNPPCYARKPGQVTAHLPAISQTWQLGPFPLPPLKFARTRKKKN